MVGRPNLKFFSYTRLPMSPRPASRDAGGSLPIRAVRFCDAITTACAFGWWIYPPLDAWLMWDGHTIFYSLDGEIFDPLDDCCDFPGMTESLQAHAPDNIQPISSPLFTALPEQGVVQVALGVIARAGAGWALLLRRPANISLFGGFDVLEGIVEVDTWRGPLFVNLRLTRTHSPIRLHAMVPLVQAQPLPQWLYQPETMSDMEVGDLSAMTTADWTQWKERFVEPNSRPLRADGEYAVAARRRRKRGCPV